MTTLETIQGILAENLDIAPEDVTEESTFESLELDSLVLVELIVALEDELDIDFGEPEGLESVGDVIEYIAGLDK